MSWQAPGYAHRLDLGGGTTGRAVLAVHEETGDLVVIRYLAVESAYFERVRTEVAAMSEIESAYFVGIREVIEQDDGIALVTDAVNGANLRHILRDTGALGAEASLLVFYESLSGLSTAHTGGLTHGDYRPENVLVSTTGDTCMIDARAASWVERDITLSTGVYLAPERWRGEEVTAAADVYAATVTFVEMLVGEPPFWEDSQLIALRYRHEQDDIPAEQIPVELRDIVRLGLAKAAADRADAVALLELVNLTAIAEYGEDWAVVGRAQLVELVSQRSLAFGGVAAIEETDTVVAGELVELDDYYADEVAGAAIVGAGVLGAAALSDGVFAAGAISEETVSEDTVAVSDETVIVEQETVLVEEAVIVEEEAVAVEETDVVAASESVGVIETSEEVSVVAVDTEADESAAVIGALAAAEVVAAAAEIVELARIEEMAAVESIAGTEEDVLTEEEELAVAEVSGIVVAVEAAQDDAVVGVAAVGGTAIAATDEELDEFDVVAAEGVVFDSVVLESESAAGAFGEGSVAAGLIAEGAAVESEDIVVVADEVSPSPAIVAGGVLVGGAVIGAAVAEQNESGVAVGMASVPPEQVAVGVAAVPPFRRRHPWLVGVAAILLIILCAGGTLAWSGHFPGTNKPSGPQTPVAALTDTPTKQSDVVPPASATPTPTPSDTSNAGVPVVSPSPSTPAESPSTGGTSTSTAKTSPSKHPKPTPSITKLPVTGAATEGLFGGAAVLILLGGGLLIIARRRRG